MESGSSLLQCRLTQDTKKTFRAYPPMSRAKSVSLVDDITVIFSPKLSPNMAARVKVIELLHKRLGVEDISLNRRNAGPSRGWSQARTSDGRATYCNG